METVLRSKIRIVIAVLAILLIVSLVALAVVWFLRDGFKPDPDTATVPDNVISEDVVPTTPTDAAAQPVETTASTQPTQKDDGKATYLPTEPVRAETTLSLHAFRPGDNAAFEVVNMFPGDVQTEYFGVEVSYEETVTVHYHADIRPGYEKLAEVLKCRVTLLTTGQTLYDGLMRDMPEPLSHTLTSAEPTVDLFRYEITAYLDTGVGNEYQNKPLIADFRWWVAEEENLEPPQTGDTVPLILMTGLCVVSLFMIILLVKKRRKEEQDGL